MFSSTIIPTIGRSTLNRAILSVLDQSFDKEDFEVIVVNDSGNSLPVETWQDSPRVTIINTNQRKLSIARNTGAAIAKGRYLHFLDDDDWMDRGALNILWTVAQANPGSVLIYGGIEFFDSNNNSLGIANLERDGHCISHIVGGAWLQVSSVIISQPAFFQAGGFDPLMLPGEETDLWCKLALAGTFAHTKHITGQVLRGEGWSTTAYYPRVVENNQRIRERVLDQTGSFGKLLASANSGYWRGRVARVYAVSCLRNLRQKRLSRAVSRFTFGIAWFVLSALAWGMKDFWQGLRDQYIQRFYPW